MAFYTSILKNRKTNTSDIKPDYSFKVVLIGEPGVGKTSIFNRIKEGIFSNHVTIGLDSCTKMIFLENGEIVKLTIWDTAGQERFQTITKNYYRNADAVLFVFAVNDSTSFNALMKWNEDVETYLADERMVYLSSSGIHIYIYILVAYKVLIGNKKDCSTVMIPRTIQDFCDVRNCELSCATSALTGEGVEEMLTLICKGLIIRNQPTICFDSVRLTDENNSSSCGC